jgi:tetratricopeptide (TPR) repeat protein
MRRVGVGSVIALVSFGVLLSVAEAVLKAVHAHWPQGVLVGLGAFAAALVGLVKPLQDTVTDAWSKAIGRRFDRAEQRRDLLEATTPGVRRVKDLDGQRAVLGIHSSIPLPEDADPTLSRELPLYVTRDVHATITTWITAHELTGGFLLLLGPAGAGKTRCLYEALREKLPDAPILLPKDAAQVDTFLATLDAKGGPAVLWLNEIYDLLGPDQLTAALIRRALSHTRPVLIVATIWRERYDSLITVQGPDLNRDAYEILARLCDAHDLATAFTASELARVEQLGTRDPRLREALTSLPNGYTDITCTLAAKPRLITHYTHYTNPYEHAVLTAAITATHLGHPDPIPEAVLKPLALAQLDPTTRAKAGKDWFTPALNAACTPLPGLTAAPMDPKAETDPETIDGYRPHDILTQTITPPVRDVDITTLIDNAEADVCRRIGAALYTRHGKTEAAIGATRKALEHGLPEKTAEGSYNLGFLLCESGDTDGARAAYQQAIDTRHIDLAPSAMINLGNLLRQLGDTDGARNAFQQAIDTGHIDQAPKALVNLGNLLNRLGDTDDARNAFQMAAASTHVEAAERARRALKLLDSDSEPPEA